MTHVARNGASICWDAIGMGEPLVLIMGLGCSSALWFRLAPRLARRYRVIQLDNRGVGNTCVEAEIHTIDDMARDVAAVLDAAGEERTHVLGFSMGGMIAQEFALAYPQRVRSLILAATNCGGAESVKAEPAVLELLFTRADMTPQQSLEVMVPYVYDAATPRRLIDEDTGIRLASYPSRRGYMAQLQGLMRWTSHARLPALCAPTLVVHGTSDKLVPPQNAEILAHAIRDARLTILDRASHMFQTDRLETTEELVTTFLAEAG